MKKQFVLLVFLVGFLPLFGQQDGVTFSLDAPENVTAGTDFEVELIFKKGELEDYSRFSQDLPEGFSASNISSPNADFTYTDQRVRIIWLKLPDEEEIHVKYAISVDERLSGQLELTGTFAYVVNGERAYLNLPRTEVINILPNPDIDPSLVVDISEFPEMIRKVEVGQAISKPFAKVIRQTPSIEQNGIVYVTVLINTPEGTSFLKLEESIPGGYSFESLDANSAVVSQAASLARFVWMRPPTESVFTIQYRLVPILEVEQQPVKIEGNLSYTEDGATKVEHPKQVDVAIGSLDEAGQLALLTTGEATGTTEPDDQGTGTGTDDGEEKVAEPKDDINPRVTGPSVINGIQVLQPVRGVVFRIQVAAVQHATYAGSFFKESPNLKEVKVEKTDQWYKYTIGPVSSYQEAVKMKEWVNTRTQINDAFIVSYRDGRRVPIEDVL